VVRDQSGRTIGFITSSGYPSGYTTSYPGGPSTTFNVGTVIATSTTLTITLVQGTANPVAWNSMTIQQVGLDDSADDNFHVQAGSPTIDAGDPTTPYLNEPGPNGGRVNLGFDGNTAQAQVSSSAHSVQVLSPGGLGKYQLGQVVPINFQSSGLVANQPVLLVDAGGLAIGTATQGNWQADAFRSDGSIYYAGGTYYPYYTHNITGAAALGVPAALFQTFVTPTNGSTTLGQSVDFQMPVADGSYTLRLFFAETQANANGYRLFNIVVNGQTMMSNVDIFKLAGGLDKAYEIDLSVSASGGTGIALQLANSGGYYPAFLNAFELDSVNAAVATTATVQISTDNGGTWSTIGTNVAVNRFGQGQFNWTVDRTTTGNTALVRVMMADATGRSNAPFLLANGGNAYYVNDGSTTGDQYTTAVGNDANSGKSPDQPLASLAALLRAYPLAAGATVYVDTGVYALNTNITIPASESGTVAAPITITGPTLAGRAAVLNRGNTNAGAYVFDIEGASNLVIENLTIKGALDGVYIPAGNAVQLIADTITGNAGNAVLSSSVGGSAITGLVISNSTIFGNLQEGIYLQSGEVGGLFSNDQVFGNGRTGLVMNGANDTVLGGSFHDNLGSASGIASNEAQGLISNVVAYNNPSSGIGASGTVQGSTAYGNGAYGLFGSSALLLNNVVYGDGSLSTAGIYDASGTASGNTVYGNPGEGIYTPGGTVIGNSVYQNAGPGIFYGGYTNNAYGYMDIANNTVHGNSIGIDGIGGNTNVISGNLIYGNTTAGISIQGNTNLVIDSNTVAQAAGAALAISNYNSRTSVEDNIFAVGNGAGITVSADSEVALASDYNLFDLTGPAGIVGQWEGVNYTTLAQWYYEIGLDFNSQIANPLFVSAGSGNYHLLLGSPAIDAGDPLMSASAEPSPNGGRINQGYDGDTAQTQMSGAAGVVQLNTPNGLQKLQVGQVVPIDFTAYDLAALQPVLMINEGGAAITSTTQGNWQAGPATASTYVNTQSTNAIAGIPGLPLALFGSELVESNSAVGAVLPFQMQVADGHYVLRLFFEINNGNVGNYGFNVIVNGQTLVTHYDPILQAGGLGKAVELDLNVTATGGTGISLQLVNTTQYYQMEINALELDQVVVGAPVSATGNVEISTDNGANWSLIGSNVAINRFGQGELNWTVDRTTAGSTALVRVTVGSAQAVSRTPFLLAPASTSYYVNDSSTVGDVYTTAPGNDANSGVSPDKPVASLAALLRSYTLTAGDTVYVDTGSYVLGANIVVPAADSGVGTLAGQQVTIIGSTTAGGTVFNRNNSAPDAFGIDIEGASNLTIANITVSNGYTGINLGAKAAKITLTNDVVSNNAGIGIEAIYGAQTTGVTISNSSVFGNLGGGIYMQYSNGAALLLNDSVYNNHNNGAFLYGPDTVMGGAYYGNTGQAGIFENDNGDIVENALVYGNSGIGIQDQGALAEGNTVFGNGGDGISASSATVTANVVYNQTGGTPSSVFGIYANSVVNVTNNTVYGTSGSGIFANSGDVVTGNRVYGNSLAGIVIANNYGGLVVNGNDVYSNGTYGITGTDYNTATSGNTISNNVVYANTVAGIALQGSRYVLMDNNTIYQSVGQALSLSANTSNVALANNILWVDQGTVIVVDASSETGFASDYNLFYQGALATPATLGSWGGTAAATLANWKTLSGTDSAGSKTGNPNFTNIAGADGVLGGLQTAQGSGLDDDFTLKPGSPAIDAGNTSVAPGVDIIGQARKTDPGSTPTGLGEAVYVETPAPSSLFVAGSGVAQGWNSSGYTHNYVLPFAFSFYGVSYTSVAVSEHGFLQFAGPNTGYDSGIAAQFLTNVRIAPFYGAFHTYGAAGNDIYISTTATSVTFRWQATSDAGNSPVNFAVTLFSNGSFRFDYGAGNAGLATPPIIGVSSGLGWLAAYSQDNGATSLANAVSTSWAPATVPLYADIGAYEFQGSSLDTTPPTITAITQLPVPGGSTPLAFTTLAVTFSKPLDPISAASPANYTLVEAAPNGQFNVAGAVVIPVTPSYVVGGNTVLLTLPQGVLGNGHYQLTLSGTKAILDVSGNRLAGDGSTAGTDYVRLFTVDRTTVQAPVATAQSLNLLEGGQLPVMLSASDGPGSVLIYSLQSQPTHGVLSGFNAATGALTYTPAANTYGSDSFSFLVTDQNGLTSTALITLAITPVNTPPAAKAQIVNVNHDSSQNIVLVASDLETPASQLVYAIAANGGPAHGTLVQINQTTFSYTPNAKYIGADSFSFVVTDTGNPLGSGNTLTATATVSINVLDTAPVGVADSFIDKQGFALVVPGAQGVLAPISNPQGDVLTASLGTTHVQHGTLVLNADGSFTYTPNAGFVGADTFTFVPAGPVLSGGQTLVTINVIATSTTIVAPPVKKPTKPGANNTIVSGAEPAPEQQAPAAVVVAVAEMQAVAPVVVAPVAEVAPAVPVLTATLATATPAVVVLPAAAFATAAVDPVMIAVAPLVLATIMPADVAPVLAPTPAAAATPPTEPSRAIVTDAGEGAVVATAIGPAQEKAAASVASPMPGRRAALPGYIPSSSGKTLVLPDLAPVGVHRAAMLPDAPPILRLQQTRQQAMRAVPREPLTDVIVFDPVSGEAITAPGVPDDAAAWMLIDGTRHAVAHRVAWEKNVN